ncbi:unnamed protein product [Protopolystoma xenopodis]|uniref:Uncharacterized protein n=1 Tax=Protopolystoma xenopodis TaxID=117903 RepID=A0A3S5BSS1_9PLAT|nr:unnamed protein product [Protopolystoma xenopodis]
MTKKAPQSKQNLGTNSDEIIDEDRVRMGVTFLDEEEDDADVEQEGDDDEGECDHSSAVSSASTNSLLRTTRSMTRYEPSHPSAGYSGIAQSFSQPQVKSMEAMTRDMPDFLHTSKQDPMDKLDDVEQEYQNKIVENDKGDGVETEGTWKEIETKEVERITNNENQKIRESDQTNNMEEEQKLSRIPGSPTEPNSMSKLPEPASPSLHITQNPKDENASPVVSSNSELVLTSSQVDGSSTDKSPLVVHTDSEDNKNNLSSTSHEEAFSMLNNTSESFPVTELEGATSS